MTAARLPQPTQKKQRYWLKAFLLAAGTALVFFLPFLIYDQGLFLYYGDFNVQQIPFYQMIHDAVRNGNLGWSHTTDLGANTIGSYSFYLLGSPFFWLTIPFPSEAVPYLMAPLLILKTGCASLTAYIYLRKYVRNKNMAVMGGMLYALCGFCVFNIFFNHFHEAVIMFPLLLAAIDEFMTTHRRGVVALAVFGSCIVNYYFFVGMVIFVIIYWFIKMLTGYYKIKAKDFFIFAFEILLGFAATAVLLFPSVIVVSQNSRVSHTLTGWSGLIYSSSQRYALIISSFFFPPDIPAYPNFAPESNAKWGSVSAWLPLFSVTGMVAFLQTKNRKHWLKKLLPLLLLFAMVPILNSVFQLFNSQYYARWYYMIILMMCLATVTSLEDLKVDWGRAFVWTGSITAAIAIAIGFMPVENKDDKTGITTTSYGLMSYPERFWAYVAIALISLAILIFVLKLLKKDRKKFVKYCFCFIGVISVFYTTFFIALGKSKGYDSHSYMIDHVINKGDTIDLPETDNVRTDFYSAMDNSGMFWQMPTIQAFHSIVPASVMEFYKSIGVQRDVGSRPDTKVYGIRSLTSTRWLFDYTKDANSFKNTDGTTQMPNWKYYDTQNDFDIYENENYIPMGFTYDYYISQSDYEKDVENQRHLLLLKAMVLTDEQMEKYSDITSDTPENFRDTISYSNDAYTADCKARKESACSYFAYDNDGFSATISVKDSKDTLVFFSVPYEEGWSATVNGEAVDVEKVSEGFMAVRVPGGTQSDIRFNYHTPGLNAGIAVTIASIIIFAGYMAIWGIKKNKKIKENMPSKAVTYRVYLRVTQKLLVPGAVDEAAETENTENTEQNKTTENDQSSDNNDDNNNNENQRTPL